MDVDCWCCWGCVVFLGDCQFVGGVVICVGAHCGFVGDCVLYVVMVIVKYEMNLVDYCMVLLLWFF